jgi:hypothetical protein
MSVIYIDTNYEVLPNGNLQLWQKGVFADGSGFMLALIELDCQQKRSRTLQETIYDNFNRRLKTKNHEDTWAYIIPDSIGEKVFLMLCWNQEITPRKTSTKSSTKISLAEIITTAASLRESPNIRGNVIREVSLGEQLILSDEESVGNWYKVIDKESQTEGWLHKTTFKIIKPNQAKAKTNKKNKKQIRQNR